MIEQMTEEANNIYNSLVIDVFKKLKVLPIEQQALVLQTLFNKVEKEFRVAAEGAYQTLERVSKNENQ
jgi:hypothetical protein